MAKYSPAIGIETYSLFVNPIRQTAEKVPFGDLALGKTLFTSISKFLTKLKNMEDDEESGKLFEVISLDDTNAPYLTGILESGEYGSARRVANKKSRRATKNITRDEADLRPYYFLFYLPNNGTIGKMLVQSFKGYGIQTLLWKQLEVAFRKEFPELRLKCKSFVPVKLIDELANDADIRQLTFEETQMPTDIANEVWPGKKPTAAEAGSLKIVLQPGRNSSFPLRERFKRMLKGQISPREFIHLEGVKPDVISVKIRANGRD